MAEHRGIFKEDINSVQYYALSWLLSKQFDEEAEMEHERMKYTILASNIELYKAMFEATPANIPDVEWISPQSIEDASKLVEYLEGLQTEVEVM